LQGDNRRLYRVAIDRLAFEMEKVGDADGFSCATMGIYRKNPAIFLKNPINDAKRGGGGINPSRTDAVTPYSGGYPVYPIDGNFSNR